MSSANAYEISDEFIAKQISMLSVAHEMRIILNKNFTMQIKTLSCSCFNKNTKIPSLVTRHTSVILYRFLFLFYTLCLLYVTMFIFSVICCSIYIKY